MTQAEQYVLDEIDRHNEDCRIICPSCGPERKKKYERTLSITIDPIENKKLYHCWHCGLAGAIKFQPFYQQYMDQPGAKKPAKVVQIPTQLNDSTNQIVNWFAGRGIKFEGAPKAPVVIGRKWYHKTRCELDSIGFVYGSPDKPEAIKWRAIDQKVHTQDGAARSFYNLENLPENPETLIIVEGEPDVAALESIGIVAVSVPNGAPDKPLKNRQNGADDKKFAFLWESREMLEQCKKVILCVDDDEPGDLLSDELARRIGRAKCWRVRYPDLNGKDPTDIIKHHGEEAMIQALDNASPMPLHGVYGAVDYEKEFETLYLNGHGRGESTGIDTVDELFTVNPGRLTVVTGLPNSGKSEFVDMLLVNLALHSGWSFAVASFENPPATHMAKLSEKIVGKPFYEGVTPRMNRTDLEDAKDFIDNHFVFLDSKDGVVPTVDSIIDRTKQAVMRLGVKGLVIDPYNYIEMSAEKEHKGISDMLTQIVMFAKAYDIHVWFIAHPKAMIPLRDGSFPVPNGMHISGGPTWFAKADLGITVHRGEMGVEIHCWKCRLKWEGKQGMVYVDYDVPTGRYRDYPDGAPQKPMSEITSGRKAWYDVEDDL